MEEIISKGYEPPYFYQDGHAPDMSAKEPDMSGSRIYPTSEAGYVR
jgi:hypothetical protein